MGTGTARTVLGALGHGEVQQLRSYANLAIKAVAAGEAITLPAFATAVVMQTVKESGPGPRTISVRFDQRGGGGDLVKKFEACASFCFVLSLVLSLLRARSPSGSS